MRTEIIAGGGWAKKQMSERGETRPTHESSHAKPQGVEERPEEARVAGTEFERRSSFGRLLCGFAPLRESSTPSAAKNGKFWKFAAKYVNLEFSRHSARAGIVECTNFVYGYKAVVVERE